MKAHAIAYRVAIVLMAALFLLSGCSSDNVASVVAAKNSTNIKRILNLYSAYMQIHGKGPADEEHLKDFITKDMSPQTLMLMTIDPAKVDELFISERDRKPFKIKPSLSWGGPGSPNPPVVFESEGRGGIRQVAFGFGNIEDVDDAKYKALWDGKGS
jgi:hypothetical protein